MLASKTLLVVAHSYHTFQKAQVETAARYFRKVYVLVRYKPLAEIASVIPISMLTTHRKRFVLQLDGVPDNVTVIPTPVLYLPGDNAYRGVGEKHYNAVQRAIVKHRIAFDIVHAHFLWSAGHVAMRLKQEYGVPALVTAHGYDVYSLPFKDNDWRERIRTVLQGVDARITVSESNRRALHRITKLDVRVLPNGYDSALFTPADKAHARHRLGLPAEQTVIVAVGNLVEVKGHEYLVKAMRYIRDAKAGAKLFIIGEGRKRRSLQALIRRLGLLEAVQLIGARRHAEIPVWMNAADLFVLPSISESFGVVQLEALACGLPVVATRNGGSEELIVSEDYGLLCDKQDASDLANKMVLALAKSWQKEKLVSYARRFAWDNIGVEIARIYHGLLANKGEK